MDFQKFRLTTHKGIDKNIPGHTNAININLFVKSGREKRWQLANFLCNWFEICWFNSKLAQLNYTYTHWKGKLMIHHDIICIITIREMPHHAIVALPYDHRKIGCIETNIVLLVHLVVDDHFESKTATITMYLSQNSKLEH